MVYAGHCSKIMLNSQIFTSKMSIVEKRLNGLLVIFFILQLCLCGFLAALALQKDEELKENSTFMSWNGVLDNSASQFVIYFLMFYADTSSIMPISLVVSL